MTKKKIMNMKQKYSVLLTLFLMAMLAGCHIQKDDYFTDNGCFQVECINSSENNGYSEIQDLNYYYLSGNKGMNRYKIDTQERELISKTENAAIIYQFKIPYVIYTYAVLGDKYRVNRIDLENKKEECIYEAPESKYPIINIIGDDLYIQMETQQNQFITYRCPVDGDAANQLQQIENTQPFSCNVSTSEEQYISLVGHDIAIKKNKGSSVYQYFSYQVDGGLEKPIDCFNKKGYANSRLVKGYLTADKENEIRGIMCVSGNPIESVSLNQGDIVRDMLFDLNLDTGESQILYDTKNNQTRIVGYEDGIVYLFKNDYKVYSQPLEGGKATEILSIPRSNDVIFDWCEDYLFVRYRDTNNRVDNQYPQYDIRGAKVK